MRAKLWFLFLSGILLTLPARADELFRAGIISCKALSPSVTAMTVSACSGGIDARKGALYGTCEGAYTANRVKTKFSVAGVMRVRGGALPDNDIALAFDYRGVRCKVESWRLASVHDCRYYGNGAGMQCDICFVLGGKRCYTAWLAVTVGDRQRVSAVGP